MKEIKRKTKIVGTIGPASESKEILRELMKAGLDVARINFSHGGYEENKDKIDNIKAVREELNLPVALMLDTKGPEIRTGKQESGDEKVEIKEGSEFTFVNEDIIGNETKTSISYKNIYNEVKPGDKILVDDGAIEFKVKEIRNKDVVCETINTGMLGSRKTVNVPGLHLDLPAISEKDRTDILNGIKADFDYIAASFVRNASDVKAIRQLLDENGGEEIKIISKIESQEGIDNIDEIIEVSDGIMVARGDMAVEIPFEKVPIIQKNFVKRCNRVGKPVIIATQMLETMMSNPRPTRAEVSDVANAVYDETNAIMLSGECAIGKFPLECVQTMDKIATSVDNDMNLWKRFTRRAQERGILNPNVVMTDLEASIARTTCVTALQINADAIAAYTHTGSTVTRIAGLRPKCPIIAVTDSKKTYHQLSVSWNVYPIYVDSEEKAAKVLYKGIETLKKDGFLEEGDTVLLSGGPRTKVVGETESKVLGGVVKV
ncbi:MAG: pyruvate kinase [Clostridia bacterium]|nr:pyruvate kinase [Clostridia bacterium]